MKTFVLVVLALLLASFSHISVGAEPAGICLSRDPSPPGAVYNDGTDVITFEWLLTYQTHCMASPALTLEVLPLSGAPSVLLSTVNACQASPIAGSFPWTVPAGATPGNYYARLSFYSDWPAPYPGARTIEDDAAVSFTIAGAGRFRILKFNDWDGDGKWDRTAEGDAYDEPVIPNWTFRIERPVGTLVTIAETGANGYTDDIVLPMVPYDAQKTTYYIQEIMPPCWERTTPAAEPYQLDLPQGVLASAIEYGNWQPAKLKMFKFNDANGNCVRDANVPSEQGLPGWKFQIERPLGTVVKTVETGQDGCTEEVKLPVDPATNCTRYWVREMPASESCWIRTTPADNPHPVDLTSCVTTVQEFGNWQPVTFRICKFNDLDGDGQCDNDEGPLADWEFTVKSPLGATATTKTGANGYTDYFTGPAGQYEVTEVVPPGWVKTTQGGQNPFIVDAAGCEAFDVLVGNRQPICLTGQVRLDMAPWPWMESHWVGPCGQENQAGWEPGPCQDPLVVEGIAGVPVELWHNGIKLSTTVTDGDGKFAFCDIPYRPDYQIKTTSHAAVKPCCDPDIPNLDACCIRPDWPGAFICTVAMSATARDFVTPCDLDLNLPPPTVVNQQYGCNYFYQRWPCRIWGIVHPASGESTPPCVEITVEKQCSEGGPWMPWTGTPASCSGCGFYEVPVIDVEPGGIRHGCPALDCRYRLTAPPPGGGRPWSVTTCCEGPHCDVRITPDTAGPGSVSVEVDVCPGTDVRIDFFLSADTERQCYLPVTLTQQDWRDLANPNTPGIPNGMLYTKFPIAFELFTHYGTPYTTTIVAGKTKTLKFTGTTSSLTRLASFFPQTGPPGKLKYNYSDPATTTAGVLAGEVLALTLNVGYNDMRVMPRSPGYDLEKFIVKYGFFRGRTVGDVLDIAHRVLGGDPLAWYGIPDYDTLVETLQAINANYQMSDINTFNDRGYLERTDPPSAVPGKAHAPKVPWNP